MHIGTHLEEVFRLKDGQKKALNKLGIHTVRDLLYHFPSRYEDTGDIGNVVELEKGASVTLYGKLSKLKTKKAWRSKIPMAEGVFEDSTGKLKVVWFHQPYIAKMVTENAPVKVTGKISERKGELYLSNPEVERLSGLPATGGLLRKDKTTGKAIPVYPESRGITSLWFYYAIQKVLSGKIEGIEDPLPPEMLKQYNLPTLKTALVWIHQPKKEGDAKAARKRFSFETIFFIQLAKQRARKKYEAQPSFEIEADKDGLDRFIGRFGFEPTRSQKKVVGEILHDISTPHAMSRLLEGDVGSGKTFIAAATSYLVVTNRPKGQDFGNLQVAYMAPTEVLATQLFESFIEFFSAQGGSAPGGEGLPINIGLITGSGCRKFPSKAKPGTWTSISRTQLLKWVENGEIPILIGTHALIQKSVNFKHLAYVIIDEQHRFGTNQRAKLTKKGDILPHLLSMTATPIPRTLALTIYGDLDLSLLDEMPPGRKQVITEIVEPAKRKEVYEKIRKEIQSGRQAYVICPRIDEPDPEKALALRAKSVKEEKRRLDKEVFPEFKIEMLHGKMRPKEKDEIMKKFQEGGADILVATSVIEVGVNVPNATVIIIEGAERFGLAQLHQLRGRVLRSTHQSYCYVFSDTKGNQTIKRLKALRDSKNGFELAEEDLKNRGAGELSGGSQWGISDIGMEALQNIKMVEAARNEARDIVEEDPELTKHPLLKDRIELDGEIHFE